MRQAWRLGGLIAIPALAGLAAWLVLRSPAPAEESEGAGGRAAEVAGDGPTLQASQGAGRPPVARGALAIRGRALLSYGKPAVGARVSVSLDKVGLVARATVGADGRYAVEGLAKGLYGVEAAWLDGELEFGARGLVSAGIDDYDMTLTRRPRTVEISVLTPAGEPCPRFDARLVLPAGTRSLGVRGEGRLRLEVGLGATQESVADLRGTCLEIWAARDLDDRALGLAPQRVGPLGGDERELEVRLVAGPVVEGRVLGPDGPLGDAVALTLRIPPPERSGEPDIEEVLARFLPGGAGEEGPPKAPALRPPFEGIVTRVKTDAQGTFRVAFHGPESAHVLRVVAPEGFLAPRPLSVTAGDAPLEIQLRRAVEARITVLGPKGNPRARVAVTAEMQSSGTRDAVEEEQAFADHDGEPGWSSMPSEVTDVTGVALLTGLDSERVYVLRASPFAAARWMPPEGQNLVPPEVVDLRDVTPPEREERLSGAAAVSLPDWRPADTVVRLEAAYTLSGVVVDTDGRPVDGAQVALSGVRHQEADEEVSEFETTDAEGRFRFAGLKRGVVDVSARAGGASGFSAGGFSVGVLPEPVDPEVAGGAPPAQGARSPAEAQVTIAGDVTGVTLRLPKSYTVTLRLAAEPKSAPATPADLLRGLFGSSMVQVLRRFEDRWIVVATEFIDPTPALRGKERTTEVAGLEPDVRYAVWMKPEKGRYIYEEFDAKVGSLVLARREGASITGRVLDLPPGAPHALVSAHDARGLSVDDVKTDAEGRFEVRGLPPGRWTVSALYAVPGRPRLVAEREAPTGGSVELRLVVEPEDEIRPRPPGVR